MQIIEFEGRRGIFFEEYEAQLVAVAVGLAGLSLLPYPGPRNIILKFLNAVKSFYEDEKRRRA